MNKFYFVKNSNVLMKICKEKRNNNSFLYFGRIL